MKNILTFAINPFFENEVWISSLISWSEIWRIRMKFLKLKSQYVASSSYKFHGDWPQCYKTIGGKVSVIVYACQQVYACKSNDRFL